MAVGQLNDGFFLFGNVTRFATKHLGLAGLDQRVDLADLDRVDLFDRVLDLLFVGREVHVKKVFVLSLGESQAFFGSQEFFDDVVNGFHDLAPSG